MEEATLIGVDLAKNVFHLHGARADGSIAFRKKLSRPQFHKFMAGLARCLMVMEACGGAHHWAREDDGYCTVRSGTSVLLGRSEPRVGDAVAHRRLARSGHRRRQVIVRQPFDRVRAPGPDLRREFGVLARLGGLVQALDHGRGKDDWQDGGRSTLLFACV
mgnify:CR=1 FL=1